MNTGADMVLAGLEEFAASLNAKASLAMEEVAAALKGWAKSEHGGDGPVNAQPSIAVNGERRNPPHDPPFWDLTGATTNSIKGGIAEVSKSLISAYLSAGMDYDVELELARDGKWAFLWPTITRHKDDILAILQLRLTL